MTEQVTNSTETAGARIALVTASFNEPVTGLLLEGCRATLLEKGLRQSDLEEYRVPGAWELPLACQKLVNTGRYAAVIALGAVIRGETAHFDFISAECARGLQQVSLDSGVPVAFGVLTTENGEQAMDRADPARKNKGREVALAALAMVALNEEIADVS
ncbi:6,7-dimethyl-8-ribityllumazine synthase [Wenzhouxiangella marina]|uniref:6,7-dimethyl-8-ribityllumazine synthase n=1 Tax=Wenzhouxiangella marina TaxID=1579979 RepID=A0A0K0XY37_9GAMM|nr:6,7-dimethyl-8-ribityllumazine synthase [Wenzhouxiangella marina]AKS42598.1 6,7-dimethyl-8-ribityllumazine synthase [Wenzhouxiangella marina]MBB6085620.1 6,7-dimethyl-8-ribityllumazine synthase [Wenzhouxiangella marina]